MSVKKISENEIFDQYYELPFIKPRFFVLIIPLCVVLGFLFHFPINKIIVGSVAKIIASQRACPINYSELKVGYLLPKLILKDAQISGACFRSLGNNLSLGDTKATLIRPAISPLGLVLNFETNLGGFPFEADTALGLSEQKIKINDQKLELSSLAPLTKGKVIVQGQLDISGLINLAKNKIKNADLTVTSNSFKVNSINYLGLKTPALLIQDINLKAKMTDNKTLDLQNLVFGKSESASLSGELRGKLSLNQFSLLKSRMDLKGKIRFSQEVLESLPIIKLLLGSLKADSQGYFNVSLTGTLDKPKVGPL